VSVVAVPLLGLLFASVAAWLILGHPEWIATMAAAALMLAIGLLWIYRRILRSLSAWYRTLQYQTWQQIQSLLSLFSLMHITHPLPPMRGAAILPDLANVLLSLVLERKPDLVVEAGSGVSTLIIAYALRHVGKGRLISLEHEHTYFARTTADLTKHGLTDIAAVVYAPLKTVNINGDRWRWYDMAALATAKQVDLVFIDGPPGNTQKLARYPALPLLMDGLSEDAVILIDDVNRGDERTILRMWTTQFPDFTLQFVETFKKAAILRRTADQDAQRSEKD
jgi:predicted O-methyltransferase YrrM